MILKHKSTGLIIDKEIVARCKKERTKLAIQSGKIYNIQVQEYSYEEIIFGDDFVVVNEDDLNIEELREVLGVFYYLRREDRPVVKKLNKKIKALYELANKTKEYFA